MPRNANQSKQSNYSMDFDGTNYIDCGTSSSLDLPGNFTISFWFNADSFTNYPHILSKIDTNYYGWRIQLDATDIRLQSTTNSTYARFKASRPSNTNQWYSVIFTFDGANVLYYLDGQATTLTNDGPTSTWITPVSSGKNFRIAKSPTIQPGFNGKIDGVAIFDYALSSSQITTLWGGGTATSNPMALPSPPIAYYPLGESAGGFVGGSGTWLTENNAIEDYVFDFSSDLIDSNFSLTTGQTQFSASIWVKFTGSLGNDESLIANESGYSADGFAIFKNASNTIEFRCESQSAIGTTTIALNKWYLATATYNAGAMVLYVNGQQEATQTTATSITQPSTPKTRLGKYITGNLIPFTGELSNAQIFNTALSATEVETLYNYGSPIQTLANIPQNSNLKAWYKLDASEIYDSSSTEWSVDNNQNPSAYQSSLDFVSSESDYITVSNSTALSSYSISCWVNARTLSSYGRLVSLDSVNHRFLGLHSDGTLISGYASPGWNQLFTTSTINTDTWNHIVLVDNGTNTKIYVNTVENTLSNSIAVDGPNYYIGSYGGSQNFFDGKLSNVSIWNTALTSAQITEIYNNGTPSSLSSHSATSNLVSWYKLNNTTTGIQDSKGSNNGTNNGATEYPGFVNVLAGESSGMSQTNLVQSDLQTVAPYSKYAMNFDASSNNFINCGNDSSLEITGNFTISTWINITSDGYYPRLIGKSNSGNTRCNYGIGFYNYKPSVIANYNGTWYADYTSTALSTGVWYNVVGIYDGSNFLLYVNGALDKTTSVSGFNIATAASETSGDNLLIAEAPSVSDNFDGKISNVSIWNTNLTHTQVREIYNEGLPKDLNSHSAYSNLISWWQLGENSSFATNWICADEKGSNNGDGQNMGVDALVNGVGTTANGTSTGMAVGALVGDAPYSTANAVSSGMAVTAKGTDVP